MKTLLLSLLVTFVVCVTCVNANDEKEKAKELYNLALQSYQNKNFKKAIAYLREAQALSKNSVSQYFLALNLEQDNQTEEAIAEYLKYLNTDEAKRP
jgi:outer membrane protein assembly factor BamD (BamD/ComL family)